VRLKEGDKLVSAALLDPEEDVPEIVEGVEGETPVENAEVSAVEPAPEEPAKD